MSRSESELLSVEEVMWQGVEAINSDNKSLFNDVEYRVVRTAHKEGWRHEIDYSNVADVRQGLVEKMLMRRLTNLGFIIDRREPELSRFEFTLPDLPSDEVRGVIVDDLEQKLSNSPDSEQGKD